VTNNDEKGLAFSGVDFEHILYSIFDATIITIENTYMNIIKPHLSNKFNLRNYKFDELKIIE
jgi:hypothetical protein